ncbi:SOS response-associated peptidase family protein [Azomonas macrocytogenes]|uniref:Abasic site processing protein n=1 Tax=Azomonas macrocytogenes TaxID=69962 RepID=A0A839T619_AZOMA|nr:SOS response-associated peptidase family protein [Azomonas macrocytogenes]MBB3104280.1 putative SOS response-associated peptidase YedK [Azomonas macrocytogenes]
MCGRFSQYRAMIDYLEALGDAVPLARGLEPEPIGRYNVAPRSKVQLLYRNESGLCFDPVTWGYAPSWARGKKPPAINARVETMASSRFFHTIWQRGDRALVGADGWYEWKKDPHDAKRKQPYFIRLKQGEPLFFAALGQFAREGGAEEREGDGFVIVTMASAAGMAEIHDRRPLVLTPEAAREWLDHDLPAAQAEELALQHALPVTAFEWYPVDKGVGNVRNEGAERIRPIPAPLL